MASKMKYAKGERLNIHFNSKIRLEFHSARLTSDGGLLAYRELDEALGLFESVPTFMNDKRAGRNIQHDMTNLLRQSVYSRLAGYEDVNDAHRLSVDPVMRAVTGKKKNAASANTIGLFETEILALKENLEGLPGINGRWIQKAMEKTPHHRIILDMDSSESPVLGNFLRRLALPGKIKQWSLRSLLVKLIKIGAKVIRHSRSVTFQMAEVAISKEIFAKILSRINRLRCCYV